MILQALYDYYQRKAQDPESALAPAGFSYEEIAFIFELREDGTLNQIMKADQVGDGKKKKIKPVLVPQRVKRASNISANLLWDNAEYVFGIDTKGKPERVKEQQAAFLAKIQALNLADKDKGIAAVIEFLTHLDQAVLAQNPLWEEIEKTNPNLSFRLQGETALVCQSRAVQMALANRESDETAQSTCLITGETAEIERLHPAIKGVWGAQTAGANIISFNLAAFASYGKSQSFNAPVSKEAAFAYTTALNHLLGKDSKQRMQVGDASTVFWASKEDAFEDNFAAIWGAGVEAKDDPDRNTPAVKALFESVGKHGTAPVLSETTRFFILGLAPNAARISIRFWHVATVLEVGQKIVKHFEDLEIIRGANDKEYLPLWLLLRSIAHLGKADNVPSELAGEVFRRILLGLPYPETLLTSALRRNYAEQTVTYERAAIIKAYLIRNLKEKVTVSLDRTNTHIGYNLGRLFAVLERLQAEAHERDLNSDISDDFYSSASTTPITVFPILVKLHTKHLSKLAKKKPKRAEDFERWFSEIYACVAAPAANIECVYPKTLSLAEQGNFAVGFYHQKKALSQGFHKATEQTNSIVQGETA